VRRLGGPPREADGRGTGGELSKLIDAVKAPATPRAEHRQRHRGGAQNVLDAQGGIQQRGRDRKAKEALKNAPTPSGRRWPKAQGLVGQAKA